MHFKLVSDYIPTGDQPTAIEVGAQKRGLCVPEMSGAAQVFVEINCPSDQNRKGWMIKLKFCASDKLAP